MKNHMLLQKTITKLSIQNIACSNAKQNQELPCKVPQKTDYINLCAGQEQNELKTFRRRFRSIIQSLLGRHQFSGIISWIDHGVSWTIHEKKIFEKIFMRILFPNLHSYASFLAVAKACGFEIVSAGSHEIFLNKNSTRETNYHFCNKELQHKSNTSKSHQFFEIFKKGSKGINYDMSRSSAYPQYPSDPSDKLQGVGRQQFSPNSCVEKNMCTAVKKYTSTTFSDILNAERIASRDYL